MTVVDAEQTMIHETEDPLVEMEVSGVEIMAALPDEEQAKIVESFNTVCDDWNEEPVESVTELPDAILADWEVWVDAESSLTRWEILLRVLEARDRAYTWSNPAFYTVVTDLGDPPLEVASS
jgi:hypothetical protein